MAYKFQIGTFVTSGSIDVSSGDIDLNDGAVENADLAGNITSDKMASFEAGQVAFSGDADAFVSSETAKHNLDLETAARVAGDTNLQNSLNTEIADRISGDATLQSAINAETTRATAAEAAIQADVDQNEADGDADRALIRTQFAAADSALSSSVNNRIDSEVSALESADTALQNSIDVEKGRIDAMLSGSSVDLDTLIEIVDAYELADTNIISTITALQNDVNQNELDGDNDRALIRSEFAAADSALSSSINNRIDVEVAALDADITALEAADVTLQSNIDAEETARIAGDAALSTSITNLSSAVSSSFASQQSDFDADIAALQAEIDAEEVRAVAAEAALSADITALSGAVAVDLAALQADVDQNEADADAAILAEEQARIAADGVATTDRALIRSEFAAADSALSSSLMVTINALQADVDANELDADNAIAALQADVDQNELDADAAILAEETARIAADGAATTDRAAIRTEFAAADTTLQNNIDVEKARIDAMLSGSSVDLDTLIEIVDAYELADTNIISTITALQNDVNQNELDGDNDRALIRSEFAAADTALSGAINTRIDSEVSALEAADNAATTDRAAIRSEFAAADSLLSSSVNNRMDQEVLALEAADTAATTDRAAIRSEFAAADLLLQNSINSLSSSFAADLAAAEQEHQDDYAALFAVTSLSANGSAATSVVFVDAASGNVTVTVPAGTTAGEYKRIKRKDASANSVSLSGNIEGVSGNSVSMFDNAALMLVWDGAMWWIM